jgi:hypothetical protein
LLNTLGQNSGAVMRGSGAIFCHYGQWRYVEVALQLKVTKAIYRQPAKLYRIGDI